MQSVKVATRAMNRLKLSVGGSRGNAQAPRWTASCKRPRSSLSGARRALVGARRVEEVGSKSAIANVGALDVTGTSSSASTKQITTSKYKLKTRKAAVKRFKVTANGKVLRRKQGKQHLNTKKNAKRKRFLSAPAVVEKSDIPNIKGSMPNHKIK